MDSGVSDEISFYKHRRLNGDHSIRLIKLHESNPTTRHEGASVFSLVERSLGEPGLEYIAISYAWGTEDHTASLRLREVAHDAILRLTPSAHEAVKTIVSAPESESDALYWMDQICINQKDDAEKSLQVQMMGDIFRRASRTVIWLGPEDDATTAAFSLLHEIEAALPSADPGPVRLELMNSTHDHIREVIKNWYGTDILPPTSHPGWPAIVRLLRRQWFSRLWTFQEAVLSSSNQPLVHSGSHQAPLIVLIRVALLLGLDPKHGMDTIRSRSALYDIAYLAIRHNERKPVSLFRLLKTNDDHDCGDPRDRVYALLGLLDEDKEMRSITVDYSISMETLYKQIAWRVISSQRSLRICAEAPERNIAGVALDLPSWVCNWTCSRSVSSIEYIDYEVAFFKASLGYPYRGIDNDSDCLALKGRVIDAVQEIIDTPPWDRSSDIADQRAQLLSETLPAVYDALHNASKSIEQDELAHKIITTCTADGYIREVTRDTEWPPEARSKSTCKQMLDLIINRPEMLAELDAFQERWIASFVTQCDHVTYKRRFAILGHFGLAVVPWSTRVGDVIAILHGSSMPFVLRQMGEAYRMIGVCFVDGMMYGERVTWAEEDADVMNIV